MTEEKLNRYKALAAQGDITAQYRLADLLMEGGENLDAF